MKSTLTLIAGLVLALAMTTTAAAQATAAQAPVARDVVSVALAAPQDPVHDGVPAATGQQDHGEQDHGAHGHDRPTMEMGNSEFFTAKYEHLEPHVVLDLGFFTFYDVNLWQLYTLVLMLIIFGLVRLSFRGNGRAGWLIRVFRGWCHWLRDEVLVEVMGPDEARRFAPYFIYVFFFIAFANLLGMLPNAVTSTATIFVTATLALTTFGMMVIGGMMRQGVGAYWKNLIPHGLPAPLVPLMFVLEIIGLLVKPVALTIRLFANMLAGHLVIYSFIAMIFLFAKMLELGPVSYAPAAFAVGMSVFISIIEAFVAILQAYIFTYLSVIFVQQSLHPEH